MRISYFRVKIFIKTTTKSGIVFLLWIGKYGCQISHNFMVISEFFREIGQHVGVK